MMSALFGSMRYLGILRVHIEEEALGMDTALCGAPGAAGAVDFRDAKVPGMVGVGGWMPHPPYNAQVSQGRLSNFEEEGGALCLWRVTCQRVVETKLWWS